MKGASSTLGERFCRALIDSMPTPHARLLCVMELAKWAGTTIYLPAEKPAGRRRNAARNMLTNGMTPAEVAIALRARYGVTIRQAQRDIKKCQMSPE